MSWAKGQLDYVPCSDPGQHYHLAGVMFTIDVFLCKAHAKAIEREWRVRVTEETCQNLEALLSKG